MERKDNMSEHNKTKEEYIAEYAHDYCCDNKEEAKKNLVSFKEKWSKKYPSCVKSWERSLGNTQNLSARANCPGGILNVL